MEENISIIKYPYLTDAQQYGGSMPDWYVWLYTHIGPGIPWTWIVRAAEKNWPLAFMVGFLLLGMILVWKFRTQTIPFLIGLGAGSLLTHFWPW